VPEAFEKPHDDTIRPEAALLLSCARTQLTPEIADRIRSLVGQGIDWIALIRLAMRHDVMPLLYCSLRQACPDAMPQAILGSLRMRYKAQSEQASRYARELVRVLGILECGGIRALPYKGPALAQRLYGDVSLREFGDLDIMVVERDVPRALDLIRRSGYQLATPSDADNLPEYIHTNRELQFYSSRAFFDGRPDERADACPSGAQIELQWRFTARLACVQQDPQRFLQRSEVISLAGAQVPSLPLEVYLLVLSLHATKHKWEQLKLICDIAQILGRPNLDWKYVLDEAHDLGLKRMLAVGVLLAEDPLGAAIPAPLAQGLRLDSAARALAVQVRRGLFEKPDEDWLKAADFPFQYKIRERLRDKAALLYRNLPSKMAPDERDRQFVSLPKSISPLYYLVRPVRWAWEKMTHSEHPAEPRHT
jgi:hypothetical protein